MVVYLVYVCFDMCFVGWMVDCLLCLVFCLVILTLFCVLVWVLFCVIVCLGLFLVRFVLCCVGIFWLFVGDEFVFVLFCCF